MNRSTRAILAGTTATLVLSLAACSGSDKPSKASGLFDEVKSAKAVAAVREVSHNETKRVPKTKSECASKNKKGVCTSYRTVPDGFKTETKKVVDKPGKPAKPAMYCVELDNVNGDKDRDDVTFEVGYSTYAKYTEHNEGAKVTDMKYTREVSSCKR